VAAAKTKKKPSIREGVRATPVPLRLIREDDIKGVRGLIARMPAAGHGGNPVRFSSKSELPVISPWPRTSEVLPALPTGTRWAR